MLFDNSSPRRFHAAFTAVFTSYTFVKYHNQLLRKVPRLTE